jgi:soluble lytic murein transglycosylase-like protein
LCRLAIEAVEPDSGLPAGLLGAIARVESGRRDPLTGRAEPWPWAMNIAGEGRYAASRAEAVATVAMSQARGQRSIDVGCMQINLLHHPSAFASLEAAFDPETNVRYAVRFLHELYRRSGGDWGHAIAWYHSATPERGGEYLRRVLAALGGAAPASAASSPALVRVRPDPFTILQAPAGLSVQVFTPRMAGGGGAGAPNATGGAAPAPTRNPGAGQNIAPPAISPAPMRLPRVIVPGS